MLLIPVYGWRGRDFESVEVQGPVVMGRCGRARNDRKEESRGQSRAGEREGTRLWNAQRGREEVLRGWPLMDNVMRYAASMEAERVASDLRLSSLPQGGVVLAVDSR